MLNITVRSAQRLSSLPLRNRIILHPQLRGFSSKEIAGLNSSQRLSRSSSLQPQYVPITQTCAYSARKRSHEPLRPVPKSSDEPLPSQPEPQSEFQPESQPESPGEIQPRRPKRRWPSDNPDSASQEPQFTARRRETDEAATTQDIPANAESTSEPSEQEYRGPLPNLMQGIPSTIDAELRRAREGSKPSSLNITEDPAEAQTEEEARGYNQPPKSEYVSSSDRKKETAIRWTYLVLTLGVTGYIGYLGRNWDDEEEARKHAAAPSGWGVGLFYNRVMARLGSTMSYYKDPVSPKLLPDEHPDPNFRFPFTLVVSLEDMLIHSEWTREKGWRIAKRPGVDYFLRYLGLYYEIVVFTSQPVAIADQVIRKLDPFGTIHAALFREATLYEDGGYVKDLSYLNRDLKKIVVIDTDKHHVKNQPENAIILPKWTGDPNDKTLVEHIPFLEFLATMNIDDARKLLKSFEGKDIPTEFNKRIKNMREKELERQAAHGGKKKRSGGGIGSLFGVKQDKKEDEEPKMLWDIVRERGQAEYAKLDKRIKDEGEAFLAERAAE